MAAFTNSDVDVIFDTALTGDGKSLSGQLPMLMDDRQALLLYPTNELIKDQEKQVARYIRDFNVPHSCQTMYSDKITEEIEQFGALNRSSVIVNWLKNRDCILSNPDLFHLLGSYNYGSNQDKRELVYQISDNLDYFIFHERITEQYLQFYSPFKDKRKNSLDEKKKWPTSHAIVRPIDIAAKCIIKDTLNLSAEEIKLEMVAAIRAWLEIVRKRGATGRVIAHPKDLDHLVWQFVETFYNEIFLGYAEGQRSMLNSRLNRLKHACEEVFAMRMQKTISSTDEQQTEGTPTDIAMEEPLTDSDIA